MVEVVFGGGGGISIDEILSIRKRVKRNSLLKKSSLLLLLQLASKRIRLL